MLSARAIYQEIRDDDRTCQLFLSIASAGEAQGGWENERIASLTPDRVLAAKIRRHGADEDKHGRLFDALLRKRGVAAAPVPPAANYTLLLMGAGIGLSHERLVAEKPLSEEEVIAYLVHSRVTEQRAAEEIQEQCEIFGEDPELGPALRMIAYDEQRHLAYTHEELLRFCDLGYAALVRSLLTRYARVEIRTYRDVSLFVMRRMGDCLGWPGGRRRILSFGIHARYAWERLVGWRRMTTLQVPRIPDAMGTRGGGVRAA